MRAFAAKTRQPSRTGTACLPARRPWLRLRSSAGRSHLLELGEHEVAGPGHIFERQVLQQQVHGPAELREQAEEERIVEHAGRRREGPSRSARP